MLDIEYLVTRLALIKVGMEEWLVNAVMMVYKGTQTVVKTAEGDGKSFDVKVRLHHRSVNNFHDYQKFVMVVEVTGSLLCEPVHV